MTQSGTPLDRPVSGRVLRVGLDENRPHRCGYGAAHVGGVVRIHHALAVPEPCFLIGDREPLLGLSRQARRVRRDRRAGEEQDRDGEPEQSPLAPHQLELRPGDAKRLREHGTDRKAKHRVHQATSVNWDLTTDVSRLRKQSGPVEWHWSGRSPCRGGFR